MDDSQATVTIEAILELAVTVRDEGIDAVTAAAREALSAAGGDPIAALTIAAALIPVDQPVDTWWQPGLTFERVPRAPRMLAPCGTHAAYARHKSHDEPIDDACRDAERAYQRARVRAARAKRAAQREAA